MKLSKTMLMAVLGPLADFFIYPGYQIYIMYWIFIHDIASKQDHGCLGCAICKGGHDAHRLVIALTIYLLLQVQKLAGLQLNKNLKEGAAKVKLELHMYTKEQVSNIKIISGIK